MSLAALLAAPRREHVALVAVATAAGLANSLALLVANGAARAPEAAGAPAFGVFVLAVVAHLVATRWVAHRVNARIEAALVELKARVLEKIERADLRRIEAIGTSEVFDRLTENISVISTSASAVGIVLQSTSIYLFSLAYVAWVSPAAFAVFVPLQLCAFLIYGARVRVAGEALRAYNSARVRFLDALLGLVRGAKEIKLSRARSREVRDDFARTSAAVRDVSLRFAAVFDDSLLFLTCNLYVLLAAIVFVLPEYVQLPAGMLPALLAIALFVWGSLELGLAGYPVYVQATQAMEALDGLERALDGAAATAVADPEEDPWAGEPGALELSGLEYEHDAPDGERRFRVGPVDLTIARGEVVFLVGGNGSGKSTLLRVLTALYPPARGTLRCGGVAVEPANAAAYRELFTTIFADFHLFSRTYGLLDVDPERVRPLLQQMQLAGKTAYRQGRFTRRDLSTGQKKRLAMVLALLEDRPILVFDEWAADQDPEFRRYFYEEMIPAWKRRGKTVIAVSHDDRYFRCADRVVRMEHGRVRAIEAPRQPGAAG